MVGKIRVEDYQKVTRYSLGSDLGEVRDHLSGIDFSEPAIHVLKLQPGVGKTYAIKQFLKSKDSFIIVTASHKLISGEYERGAKHWEGLGEVNCSLYNKVKDLHLNHVPVRMICSLQRCNKRRCSYWKQFQTKKAVSPLNYLPTDRVLFKRGSKKGHFKFDLLVVDEAMKEFEIIPSLNQDIRDAINVIEKYFPIKDQFSDFMGYLGKLEIPPKKLTNIINAAKNQALWASIKNGNTEDVKKIGKLDIYKLRKFIYYRNIHGYISYYPEPLLYSVLDLAFQGIPVIFLDATFDDAAFQVLIGRYLYENSIIPRQELIDQPIDIETDLTIKIYESRLEDKDITINRMDEDNNYYKGTFFIYGPDGKKEGISDRGKEKINELRGYICDAKRKFMKVGIITFMGLEKEFDDLGPVEHFFNLKGSNKLKDMDAIFIIGTALLPATETVKDYNNLCLTPIQSENTFKYQFRKSKGEYYKKRESDGKEIVIKRPFKPWTVNRPMTLMEKDYDGYENEIKYDKQERSGVVDADGYYPLPDYDLQQTNSEKYQAIHRARPFSEDKPPEIYVFGHIPQEIEEEFKIKSFNKDQTTSHFKRRGIYPLPLFHLVRQTYAEKLEAIKTAEELRLYKRDKGSGYNTKFITKITTGEVNDKQITKLHEILLNDINSDPETIAKKLKIDKEFVEYCIYYAKEGSFIRSKS